MLKPLLAELLRLGPAVAADLVMSPEPGVVVDKNAQLPAVSGINGKWEFDPGLLTGGGYVRAAGSVSLPVGDRFGVQADAMGTWTSTRRNATGRSRRRKCAHDR